jgi:hypothetical protein
MEFDEISETITELKTKLTYKLQVYQKKIFDEISVDENITERNTLEVRHIV